MARQIIAQATLVLALTLSGCGKPADKPPTAQASGVPNEKKCPDPNIRDSKDPCSPYYWKPKDSALKNAKSF